MLRDRIKYGLASLVLGLSFAAGTQVACQQKPLYEQQQKIRVYEQDGKVFQEKKFFERKYMGEIKRQSNLGGITDFEDRFGSYWRAKPFGFVVYKGV